MNPQQSPLGKTSQYSQSYQPQLLFPIDRQQNRQLLPGGQFEGFGLDLWTAYELSWLNLKGKPLVALGEFRVPADSPCLIESKSLKLYLNSFNQMRYADMAQVQQLMAQDLSRAAQAEVEVRLWSLDQAPLQLESPQGICLDDLDIAIDCYQPTPALLQAGQGRMKTCFYSHLLKSNCLVTGQPDWGSVFIDYQGPALVPESLLAYLVSFRQHQEFHEHCVERIFTDLSQAFQPEYLRVEARYLRRGGLDINPVRCTEPTQAYSRRLIRQ